MGRMGRRRFEIRAFGACSTDQKHFGQLHRWNQTCDCCYDNSCDLFAVDSRGLTKVIEEQCLCSTQGGYSKFKDGDDRMEAKFKTPKISWTKR